MADKQDSPTGFKPKKPGRASRVPPEAAREIIDRIFKEAQGDPDELVEILKRHGVTGDPDALQQAFLKQTLQRLMSGCRDEEGRRLILAGKDGRYHLIPLCNDMETLGDIEQRLQHQIAGLTRSSDMVTRRTQVLRQMLDSLKASYRKESETGKGDNP